MTKMRKFDKQIRCHVTTGGIGIPKGLQKNRVLKFNKKPDIVSCYKMEQFRGGL